MGSGLHQGELNREMRMFPSRYVPRCFYSARLYLTVSNNGMNQTAWSAYAPGNWYPEIDNPSLAPSPSVANISSGLGARTGVWPNERSALDLTFGEGFPALGLRVGILGRGVGNDQVSSIRLPQTAGSGGGDASMTPVNGAATYFAFFDIIGAQAGDKVTLLMRSDAGGNDGIYHHGISLDQLPEPSTVSLSSCSRARWPVAVVPPNAEHKGCPHVRCHEGNRSSSGHS
ncbi:MAG: hypothetical protein N2689_00005, partial [Verrucomicrobiae bacterium]|nr:hypothetical protein [Verrucomicrobiae bacterium]